MADPFQLFLFFTDSRTEFNWSESESESELLYDWRFTANQFVLWCVHITRTRAGARQACVRRETRLAFICARKSSSTLLQLLARFRRVRIRICTRSVYRL
jgi:hypothetical protein